MIKLLPNYSLSRKSYRKVKRVLDICVSITLIVFLMPLLFITAFLITILDGRPCLFRQQRVGMQGKQFTILKFRTMHSKKSNDSSTFDAGDNSRVTYLGKLLRKTKIDELPQLWNVLRGDMSLVGPRPEIEKWTNEYQDEWKKILQIRPGITDTASIVFRNEEELLRDSDNAEETYRNTILPRKLALNTEYVEKQCFIGDLKILIQTACAVVCN